MSVHIGPHGVNVYEGHWLPIVSTAHYCVVDTRQEIKPGDKIHVIMMDGKIFASADFIEKMKQKYDTRR